MLTFVVVALWFSPALGQPPSSVDPIRAIGEALQASDYDRALELSKSELQRNPRNFKAMTLQGAAFSGQGRDREALASYKKALSTFPNFLPALKAAAELEYRAGDPHAVGRLNRILEQLPDDPTSHAMLGTLEYGQHNCAEAVKNFAKSTPLIATRPTALAQYAECLIAVRSPEDAVPVFQQIVVQFPDEFAARYILAEVQMEAGRGKDVVETLQPLLQLTEPDPDVLNLASSAYESFGNTPMAVELIHRAIVSNPNEVKYYLGFAMLSYNHGSFQVGIDMLNAGLQRMPAAASLYVARGVLYIQMSELKKGEADFETATHLDSKQAYGEIAQGMALVQIGNLDDARTVVESQLRKAPRESFLYYMKAQILMKKGAVAGSPELKSAIEAARRAAELSPDFVLARETLGDLYLTSGQFDLAIQQCRLALHIDATDQNALYRLIQALRRSGKASPAELTSLVRRLADLRRESREQEALRSKYKLYEWTAAGGSQKQ